MKYRYEIVLKTPSEKHTRKFHEFTCGSHDSLDLIHVQKFWAQTTVHAENLLVDDGGNREAIEAISERFP